MSRTRLRALHLLVCGGGGCIAARSGGAPVRLSAGGGWWSGLQVRVRCRGRAIGQRAVQQGLGRPGHEPAASSRVSPAMSVSQTSASIPVALRIAMASRRTRGWPSLGSAAASSASSNQPIARPWRRGRLGARARRSSDSGASCAAAARCRGSRSGEAVRRPRQPPAGSSPASGGSSDVAVDLGVRRGQQGGLVGEVPVGRRPRDRRGGRGRSTVGATPRRRVARGGDERFRVRSFWRARPASS